MSVASCTSQPAFPQGNKERRSTMYQKINHPVISRNSVEHRIVTLPAKMWIDLGEQTSGGCTEPVWTLECVYHKNRDLCFMPIVRHPWIEAWVWKAKRWLDNQNWDKSKNFIHSSQTSIQSACIFSANFLLPPSWCFIWRGLSYSTETGKDWLFGSEAHTGFTVVCNQLNTLESWTLWWSVMMSAIMVDMIIEELMTMKIPRYS